MTRNTLNPRIDLDIEPLRAWLRQRIPKHGGTSAAARDWGINERHLRTLLDRRTRHVTFDVADRIITRENSATRMGDLWPRLDEDYR